MVIGAPGAHGVLLLGDGEFLLFSAAISQVRSQAGGGREGGNLIHEEIILEWMLIFYPIEDDLCKLTARVIYPSRYLL